MGWWRRDGRAAGRDVQTGGGAGPEGAASGHPAREPSGSGQHSDTVVIDLRGDGGWAARLEPDPVRAAELAERFRARAARAEAQRDLQRLRARHWSGERVIEEGRVDLEWWEHPEADPYAILGLLPGARLDEAAAARRRIAQECHPDRQAHVDGDTSVAMRRMVAANAAYDRLRRALLPV